MEDKKQPLKFSATAPPQMVPETIPPHSYGTPVQPSYPYQQQGYYPQQAPYPSAPYPHQQPGYPEAPPPYYPPAPMTGYAAPYPHQQMPQPQLVSEPPAPAVVAVVHQHTAEPARPLRLDEICTHRKKETKWSCCAWMCCLFVPIIGIIFCLCMGKNYCRNCGKRL